VVVLNELLGYPELSVDVASIVLVKEPALVRVDARTDEDGTVEPGVELFERSGNGPR
jgi:hypothetical protein